MYTAATLRDPWTLYLAFRVAIGFIKAAVRVGGLSAIQRASLAVVACYIPHVPRIAVAVRRG